MMRLIFTVMTVALFAGCDLTSKADHTIDVPTVALTGSRNAAFDDELMVTLSRDLAGAELAVSVVGGAVSNSLIPARRTTLGVTVYHFYFSYGGTQSISYHATLSKDEILAHSNVVTLP